MARRSGKVQHRLPAYRTGHEQKAIKTTAFDLQLDPTSPGMRFHKLDRAKDPNFWSVRVSRDIRMIVHKTSASLLLTRQLRHSSGTANRFDNKL